MTEIEPTAAEVDRIAKLFKRYHRDFCYPDCSDGEAKIFADAVFAAWNQRTPTAPSGDEVERVARAINPYIWGCYDRSLVPFVEERGARNSTDDCTTYEMMWKDGCRTVEDAKNWWLTTNRPVMVRVYHFRESLQQAQAAIAAMRPARGELAALQEALTPSGYTKAAYMGEFKFPFPVFNEDGEEIVMTPNVPWTTIKEIMAAIRNRAALRQAGEG